MATNGARSTELMALLIKIILMSFTLVVIIQNDQPAPVTLYMICLLSIMSVKVVIEIYLVITIGARSVKR